MEKIKDFEVEAFYQVLQETGIKGIMDRADVLMLNHLVERGFLPHHREGIIQGLREQTEMDFSSIMSLFQRYERLKEGLPTYGLHLNQKLEQVNTMYDATINFEWVGNRMMGIVKETNGGWSIMDGSGNHMIKLGSVDEGYSINWNSNWLLQPEQLRWAVKKVREIKKRVWNEFS